MPPLNPEPQSSRCPAEDVIHWTAQLPWLLTFLTIIPYGLFEDGREEFHRHQRRLIMADINRKNQGGSQRRLTK
jgi:hypothetical protein